MAAPIMVFGQGTGGGGVQTPAVEVPSCEGWNVRDFGAAGDGSTDDTAAFLATFAAAAVPGANRNVCVPAGEYITSASLVVPDDLIIEGVGTSAQIYQTGDYPLFSGAPGISRITIRNLQLFGTQAAPVNAAIDLRQMLFVTIDHVIAWDFVQGLYLSSGVAYTGYIDVKDCEFNRCQQGMVAREHANAITVKDTRFFWCFDGGNGRGIDIEDASSLLIIGCEVESADTCVYIRNTRTMEATFIGNYWEPGSEGISSYDIVIVDTGDALSKINWFGNTNSSNRGRCVLPPSGLHRFDDFSNEYFGARFDGAAIPKRNLKRNGDFRMWESPLYVPTWFGVGTPTFTTSPENLSGGRSIIVTQVVGITDGIAASWEAHDVIDYVTVGFRYKAPHVGPVSPHVILRAAVGANVANMDDLTLVGSDPDEWRERWLQLPVDNSNRSGSVSVTADFSGSGGKVQVDEVWIVPGRFATKSVNYGQQIEMLDAAVTVLTQTTAGNRLDSFDLSTLTNLAQPMRGVIGVILQVEITVDNGGATSGMSGNLFQNAHYAYIDIPGTPSQVARTHKIYGMYNQQTHSQTFHLRDYPVITGGYITGGYTATYRWNVLGYIRE